MDAPNEGKMTNTQAPDKAEATPSPPVSTHKIRRGERAHLFVKNHLQQMGLALVTEKMTWLRGMELGLGEVDLLFLRESPREFWLVEVKYLGRPNSTVPLLSAKQVARLRNSRRFIARTGFSGNRANQTRIFLALVSGDNDLRVEFLENP